MIESNNPARITQNEVTIPLNIGTTIDPKNSKPIFENVSATIFNCESESIHGNYNYTNENKGVNRDKSYLPRGREKREPPPRGCIGGRGRGGPMCSRSVRPRSISSSV